MSRVQLALNVADPEKSADQRGEGIGQALNHLGIEGDSSAEVEALAACLRDAGPAAFEESDPTCCYAVHGACC